MKLFNQITNLVLGLVATSSVFAQCEINASAYPAQIYCGQSSVLTAFGTGEGTILMSENFNSGFGPGWSGTPGATSFSNPCSPNGVDGTPHAWMDANTSVPRTLTSTSYDLTSATAGVTICFDLKFAVQGANSPCEGPDEPDEGVYFQYSIDGGTTWVTIHYFDPNGGNDQQLVNWNNWCFQIPQAAITSSTMFRWHQTADSGADYDHWGIDNVEITQNDVLAEIIWLHDNYSYGVGSSGGANPNVVTPTTTTTYDVQITTGSGQVCTTSVTVVVLPPVYEMDVDVTPASICPGDCATITGTARQVLDPGGVETYENNEFAIVATTNTSVNINVQGINTNSIYNGLIDNVTINGFNFSGTSFCTNFGGCPCNGATISFGSTCNVNTSGFTVTLTSPGGCEIILAPQNVASGNYTNTVFVPVGGTAIGGSFPAGGPWDPQEPFSNLNGCDPNGVWTITFSSPGFGVGVGTFSGWSITFNDPPIYGPVTATWSPTTGMSNPTIADPNAINTQACPTTTTNYTLTVANDTPGCAIHQEPVSIIVDNCNGCVNPTIVIDQPVAVCSPSTVDLSGTINPTSDAATVTFHTSAADAQNDVNPISSVVNTSGTYWLRAENPSADTCFTVSQINVTINPVDNASFDFANFCEGDPNGPTGIVTPGGTFAFNPAPSDGASINASTGEIINAVAGTSYTVEYTTNGTCPSSSTRTVVVNNCNCVTPSVVVDAITTCAPNTVDLNDAINPTSDPATVTFHASMNDANDDVNPISNVVNTTGTYWLRAENPSADTCFVVLQINVTINPLDDPSFTLTDYCEGTTNAASNIATSGGTFAFNPVPSDGATINASTGAITNGVGGATYTVEYTTNGACPSSSTQNVTVNANPTPIITGTLSYCTGENATLNAGAGYASYDWSIGGNSQTVTTTAATGITVTVTDTNGCQGTSDPVTVIESNIIETTLNVGICPGETIMVHGNQVSTPGTYIDTFNIAGGCDSVSRVIVTQHNVVVPTITGDLWYCNGGVANLSVSPNNYVSYSWNIGGNQATVSTTTDQPITVTVTDANGCSATSMPVSLEHPPTAGLVATPNSGISPLLVDFSNTSTGATNYDWYVVGVDTFSTNNLADGYSHIYTAVGSYTAYLVAHSAHCSDTAFVTITVTEFLDPSYHVPNVFTPNNDGANDFFVFNSVNIAELEIIIVNRWGNVVFTSDRPDFAWDGKDMSGNAVPEGVYFFKYKMKDLLGAENEGHGFVTLER